MARAQVILLVSALCACSRTEVTIIRTADLEKVANDEARETGRDIETIDGRELSVRGDFDVVIVSVPAGSGGGRLALRHPVTATVHGGTLYVHGLDPDCLLAEQRQGTADASRCERDHGIPLSRTAHAELRQDRTNLWPIAGGLGGFVLGAVGGLGLGYFASGGKDCGADCKEGQYIGSGIVLGAVAGAVGGAVGISAATGGETVR